MIDPSERTEVDQAAMDKRLLRFQRELNWLKSAWEKGDVRVEMAALMADHFRELHEISINLVDLIEKMDKAIPRETMDTMQHEIVALVGNVTAAKGHDDRFKKLFDHLPDKHDMLLATVDTPPYTM